MTEVLWRIASLTCLHLCLLNALRLVDLVLARPLVSAGIIAAELSITPRAAQDLVAALGLREITGRGRYRAWGVL